MKFLLLFTLLIAGCSTVPKGPIDTKYKVGNCLAFGTLSVADGELQPSGVFMGFFKLTGIVKDPKNRYLNKRFNAEAYYVLSDFELNGKLKNKNLILPVKDVDSFTYADRSLYIEEYNEQAKCDPL